MLRRSALPQRPAAELDIEIDDDRLLLSETPNVFSGPALLPGRSGGVWSMHMPREEVGERDLRKRLKGHTAGKPRPHWHAGRGGALRLETFVMRVRNVDHMPAYGAVIDSGGHVYRRTAAEAPEVSLSLDRSAVSQAEAAAPGDEQRPSPPVIPSATVFVPWGARFNYSHFVLDALAGLAVIDDLNGLESHPPIAPPLTGWQRQLLDLYLGDRAGLVRELEDEVVHIKDAVFTNCMDHFLHAPNGVLRRVRERVLTSAHRQVAHPQTPRLLYLARADQMMVNQDKLVDLMRKRGFTIVQPDGLTPAEQVLLFSKAEVIVGATGASLTNVLFAPKGCKVFEIQPSNFTSVWVRQICDLIGVKWFGYFCPPPLQVKEPSTKGRLRSDGPFQYRLPLDPFVAFLRSQAEL